MTTPTELTPAQQVRAALDAVHAIDDTLIAVYDYVAGARHGHLPSKALRSSDMVVAIDSLKAVASVLVAAKMLDEAGKIARCRLALERGFATREVLSEASTVLEWAQARMTGGAR